MVMQCLCNFNVNSMQIIWLCKFFTNGGFKWIDPEMLDLNKYTSNSSKGCVLEVDLEYSKELQ